MTDEIPDDVVARALGKVGPWLQGAKVSRVHLEMRVVTYPELVITLDDNRKAILRLKDGDLDDSVPMVTTLPPVIVDGEMHG